jgi:hypothetical protein
MPSTFCGIRGVEPGTGPGQAVYEGQCPYRGLRVFDVAMLPSSSVAKL